MFVYIGSLVTSGVVVTSSDGSQPSYFGRESCCGMEILDGLFDAGEFIFIKYGMLFSFHGCLEVFMDRFCGWHDVFCVEGFCATWGVQDECVLIVIAIDLT